MWHGLIYINHCMMEGLSTAGNIQGCPADVLLVIFKSKSISPALKWVNDFVLFCVPSSTATDATDTNTNAYSYNLSSVMNITNPLRVPWHPIKVKCQDFGPTVSYVGFIWNLEDHSLSLSPKKYLKYLKKVCSFLCSSDSPSQNHGMSILRTIQHISFMYRDSRSTLLPFASFISKFPNDFTTCHAPKSVLESLRWWEAILLNPHCAHSLKPCQMLNPDLWVNASTSWGIGIIHGNKWSVWTLMPGWKAEGRDISWANSIALELAVCILVEYNLCNCSIIICSDNTGVIGAYDKGRSCNIPHNDSINHITLYIVPSNIMIIPTYVASTLNRANPIYCGILGPSHLHTDLPPVLPPELNPFLWNV